MKPGKSRQPKPRELPKHWTPEQALAVFEAVEFLRDDLWARYGPHIQQAWREQLMADEGATERDLHEPF